jgi:hypothetical protein
MEITTSSSTKVNPFGFFSLFFENRFMAHPPCRFLPAQVVLFSAMVQLDKLLLKNARLLENNDRSVRKKVMFY